MIQLLSLGNMVRTTLFHYAPSFANPNLPVGLSNSGAREALARCGWYIYVGLTGLSAPLDCSTVTLRF